MPLEILVALGFPTRRPSAKLARPPNLAHHFGMPGQPTDRHLSFYPAPDLL
jgi:hypothetical protein